MGTPQLSDQSAPVAPQHATPDGQSRGPWLNVVSHLDSRFGGVTTVVPALCNAVTASGSIPTSLAAFCSPEEEKMAQQAAALKPELYPPSRLRWLELPWTHNDLAERFRSRLALCEGVHIHGLWETHSAVAASAAQALGKPYVVSAHGMLDAWAVSRKRSKKALYSLLVQNRQLRRAACLHALTHTEVADYRRAGFDNPVALIPNGVSVPAFDEGASRFLHVYPELGDKRLVLFLGRLHPKKGVDLLCQAWAEIARCWSDAHLVIAGPDFEGTRLAIEAQVHQLGIAGRVTFAGMLAGPMKWSALRAASLFVLPSWSEGLSVAALEALGSGCPVLLTRQCNLPEVAAEGCGWTVEPDPAQIGSALDSFFRTSETHLADMSAAGRRLVARRFRWEVVGEQMAELYRWISRGGPTPPFVLTKG